MKTDRKPLTEKQAKDLQALFDHPGMDVLKNVLQSDVAEVTVRAAEARLQEDVARNPDHTTSDADFKTAREMSSFLTMLNGMGSEPLSRFSTVTIQP